ncbi:DUF4134 domain-containing protein [Ornithobacterium rhinotracheale]
MLSALFVFLLAVPMFAGDGSAAITKAVTQIKTYWGPLQTLLYAVGAVVGIIGGLRIYNKWTNGDQDINKEIMGWGGACLFLILVPTFVGAFFDMG